MSSLASQLVLHPYVSQSLKYGATNLGRDKVCLIIPLLRCSLFALQLYRTVQFLSRFLAWYFFSRGNKAEAIRWNALKNHLALGRKRECHHTLSFRL